MDAPSGGGGGADSPARDLDHQNAGVSTKATDTPARTTGEYAAPAGVEVTLSHASGHEDGAAPAAADYDGAGSDDHLSAPSASVPHLHSEDDSSSFGTPSTYSVILSVDTDNDADSALGSMMPNSSMSATSSVYEFVEEFGRTFHKYKEGKYFLPNDEQEIDLQHRIALQVLDWKLYLAPIDRPHRVLDVGTGSGIWAIEFSDQSPESDVLGTDLSPIQPEYVPANCRFEIDDVEDEWIYSHKFDYVHGRYMCAFLTDFPKLFGQAYDNLNPGGWVEFMETVIYFQSQDGSLEGTALERWNKLLLEGIRNMGRNALSCMKYKKWMTDAGFINVEEKKFIVPANPWAKGRKNKELGALQMVNNLNGVYGLTVTVFTKGLGWTTEEVEVLLADVRRDMSDKDIHSYITM
ncbi:hypothetical protein JX266_004222 [Neoarthrinium moseri]|nr:hypothetical protein JX266_004222 [Neoarthrinium moseri]